jgi:hypothetical protein
MATIQLQFSINPQDTGLAVGDSMYYIDSTVTNATSNDIINIGTVLSFNTGSSFYVLVDTGSLTFNMPTQDDYVFYSKNNNVNISDLLGYYAEMKLVNDSTEEAELFSLSVSVTESSK